MRESRKRSAKEKTFGREKKAIVRMKKGTRERKKRWGERKNHCLKEKSNAREKKRMRRKKKGTRE
jgi:hypothetical protein